MTNKKSLWINLSLINLFIVALFGFILRSKILFPLPFINYRNLLSAHSHFAFGGWAGLALITLLIYEILPENLNNKRIYQWILWGMEFSSLGMAIIFPIEGYNFLSILFSTCYIIFIVIFIIAYLKDLNELPLNRNVCLLCIGALISIICSLIGPLGLTYIIISRSYNSMLYRDSLYIFLHFQYNGFFTLSIFSILLNRILKSQQLKPELLRSFTVALLCSILPSLFFALLWHNSTFFYILAGTGVLFILFSLYYFSKILYAVDWKLFFRFRISKNLWYLTCICFFIKMILQIGTIIPSLGNAVFGDRPVIIGFLHLVFLGVVSFFILSIYIESGLFTGRNRTIISFPFIAFASAVILNETILMIEGLDILFQSNSDIFKWLLWGTAILLFISILFIVAARASIYLSNKRRLN